MNFVFFFPDEMKASSVSCYRNEQVEMPNFDRLSQEGTLLENCIVQNPVCSPSRCCLMTGTYVHNQGHRTLWHLLRKQEPSLFRYLQQEGYDIGWFGKNDLYAQEYLEEICTDLEEKRHGYREAPSRKTGMVCKGNNPYKLGDPMYYSFLYNPIPTENGEIIWDENVARGIDFIWSRKNQEKPFFLYLPLTMPHPPYNAMDVFQKKYKAEEVVRDLIEAKDTKGKPDYHALIRKYRGLEFFGPEVFAQIYATYLGMNSYVDLMLGGILEALKESGLEGDTTVIVSSDHGDWAGNYGLVEKWPNAMDDDLVRVPLIIRTPHGKKNHRVWEQVELFDIMPTVLELAGVQSRHRHFARTLVPQLMGATGDPDRAVFCEGGYDLQEPHCSEAYDPEGQERYPSIRTPENIYYPKLLQQKEHPESVCRSTMIRTLEYKLVKRSSGDNELYDLKNDPGERENQYYNPEFADIKMQLESQMLNWYIKTSDIVPIEEDPRGFM